jgi:hypothetical protein
MKLPTFEEIYATVNAVHPMSPRTLRSDLKLLAIWPVGMRQRPNRYPADAARTVLRARGHEFPAGTQKLKKKGKA